jgi:hypothetical protein
MRKTIGKLDFNFNQIFKPLLLAAFKNSSTIKEAISKVTTLEPKLITLKFLPHSAAVASL